jgi:methylthioribose-1-phosphate isomerase
MTAPTPQKGKDARSLWYDQEAGVVSTIDQTLLPHEFRILSLSGLHDVCEAIRSMRVRGAPLIGITAAFGLALALREDSSREGEDYATAALLATRPTAVNLAWALSRVRGAIAQVGADERAERALAEAQAILAREIDVCSRIGDHGVGLILDKWNYKTERSPGAQRLYVLTHCNAGWLATGGWGTALAPVYKAHAAGIPVHVWVDETRPRSQGATLTAWELGRAGVPHTVIADTAAGHVLQRGQVDLCFVGSDRTTARGDVCNKIGTYMVALAAHDNGVPFYPCVPTSSIDWSMSDGVAEIPIEQRDPGEVTDVRGLAPDGKAGAVRILPSGSHAANFAFDVTPARLVSGIVTERGIFSADTASLSVLRAQLEREESHAG